MARKRQINRSIFAGRGAKNEKMGTPGEEAIHLKHQQKKGILTLLRWTKKRNENRGLTLSGLGGKE